MSIHFHKGDIPADVDFGDCVAIDTEAMGLNPLRDRLCLMQLSSGDGTVHLVQFDENYEAPNIKKLMANPNIIKLFHYARFDLAMIWAYLGVMTGPVYCTKLASKIARTFTNQHGLKTLCKDLLGIELNKQMQVSDWGAEELSAEQLTYAASDVLYLHQIRNKLNEILHREGREDLVRACFDFIPHRAILDISGWPDEDIFSH